MTAYKALAIACYLGYSRIYVCGFDNDYFKSITASDSNELYYTDNHFYHTQKDGINEDGGDSTGESPYKVNKEIEGNSTGELLYLHHFLFKHLEKFNKYEIYNLDKNSLVDAFSKHHNLDIY